MIQFLNNIWIALSSENLDLIKLLMIPAGIIEPYLTMSLFLIIFNINCNKKQKILYVLFSFVVGTLTSNFVPNSFSILFTGTTSTTRTFPSLSVSPLTQTCPL